MKTSMFEKASSFRPAAAAAILGLVWTMSFAPAPAAAPSQGTPEQQQACTPDVMRLCSEFIPDVAKISACMGRKRAQVSATCRAAFAHPATHAGKRTSHHHHH
jgi:hypothetical protein